MQFQKSPHRKGPKPYNHLINLMILTSKLALSSIIFFLNKIKNKLRIEISFQTFTITI